MSLDLVFVYVRGDDCSLILDRLTTVWIAGSDLRCLLVIYLM